MSWQYPCYGSDVTGRQILTKEKPIGKAYRAIEEIQAALSGAALNIALKIEGGRLMATGGIVLANGVEIPLACNGIEVTDCGDD